MNTNIKKRNIQEWLVENEPSKDMIYERGYWEQGMFIRDTIVNIILQDVPFEFRRDFVSVISSHVSKSILLPVYEIFVPNHNITFTLRDNFHDWKISVSSEKPILMDMLDLFNKQTEWSYHYCEGFPMERIYSSFEKNQSEFTFELYSQYHVFTFFWAMRNYLNNQ